MKKILKGEELIKRAEELGVDITGPPIIQSSSGRSKCEDFELQRRIIEAERSLRESRLWILAFISAIASVISALASFILVLKTA